MLKQKTNKKIRKQILYVKKVWFIRSLYFCFFPLELKKQFNNFKVHNLKTVVYDWHLFSKFSKFALTKSKTIPTVTAIQQSYEDIDSAMF